MPARHPRAAFEPIAPDLDVDALVTSSANFEHVVRIPCEAIDQQGTDAFEKLVRLHVIQEGKPLVIEGYQKKLDNQIFSVRWLQTHYGKKVENARNLTKKEDLPLTLNHYLKHMAMLTEQSTPETYKDPSTQRIYLKDIDSPPEWYEKLKAKMPAFIYYLNSSTKGDRAVGVAGDLMSSLPEDMRAENMQCYIGHEGTYTPAHREMCATLGQNIMVEASSGSHEDGKPTQPGSSLWFMTESKERAQVSEFFRNVLGHDIETERHFAQINAWKAAPFTVYIVEQRVGDLILIPPLAPHQVWNRGTRTIKAAWNRTTAETLEHALKEALASARLVCRDEQYKCKAIVYFTLVKYSALLQKADAAWVSGPLDPKVKQMRKDFRRLFALFTEVLLSESFSTTAPAPKKIDFIRFDSNITCSYCRCNIFNRFLTCENCIETMDDGSDNTYDICLECYALGRSCFCISRLTWCEQFHWQTLMQKHEEWRQQIAAFSKNRQSAAADLPTFKYIRSQQERKSLAEICQQELKRRPFNDKGRPLTTKELNGEVEESNKGNESDSIDDDGEPKRKRRKTRGRKPSKFSNHKNCHICKQVEPGWRLASCSECNAAYCYGSLFRAFEIYPPEVMDEYRWKCPRCMKICSCGACRRNPSMKPFEPTVTYLGHNTLKFADPRSVEILVDFSVSNVLWLKKANNTESSGGFPVLPSAAQRQTNEHDEGNVNLVREEEDAVLTTHSDENINSDEEHERTPPVDPALATNGNATDLRDAEDSVLALKQWKNQQGEANNELTDSRSPNQLILAGVLKDAAADPAYYVGGQENATSFSLDESARSPTPVR
ncbi:hypothetical protein KEM56_000188 [Ascosphaera pollenicola]|nr:hypothetical protein KEM56_000188 [Ascosphaera pollenicola]